VARNFRALGLARPPTIIDTDDAANAIAAVIQRLGLQRDRRRRLPRKGALQAAFSRATNLRVPLAEVVRATCRTSPSRWRRCSTGAPRLGGLQARARLRRLRRRAGDGREAARRAEVRERIAAAWRYVLVDEYQDVNAWQADIALRLAAPHGNLMVVGDPKQSIYAFRGARYEKIVGFADEVPGARVVHLTDNYRSTQAILDVANAVMGLMEANSIARCVRPRARRVSGRCCASSRTSGRWPTSSPTRCRIASVTPAPSAGTRSWFATPTRACRSRASCCDARSPSRVRRPALHGGRPRQGRARRLRILHNGFDELAWLRMLQLLDGVGETTAARWFADFSDPDALAATGEAAPSSARRARVDQAGGKGARRLADLLAALVGPAATSVAAAYDHVVAWYLPGPRAALPERAHRHQDLAFFRIVVERAPDLASLLADLALDPETTRQAVAAGRPEATEGLRPLTISTIHSAKGLEWDFVVLVGVDDRTLPSPWAVRRAAERATRPSSRRRSDCSTSPSPGPARASRWSTRCSGARVCSGCRASSRTPRSRRRWTSRARRAPPSPTNAGRGSTAVACWPRSRGTTRT
jgi:DNA helicase II / ATP-dependent DNA helicase PcrA